MQIAKAMGNSNAETGTAASEAREQLKASKRNCHEIPYVCTVPRCRVCRSRSSTPMQQSWRHMQSGGAAQITRNSIIHTTDVAAVPDSSMSSS